MEKIKEIIFKINNLTLLESYELVKELEKIYEINISTLNSSPLTNNILENTNQLKDTTTNEKTEYDIILQSISSDNKINLIKTIKNITGLSLKESKDIVDNVPKLIKKGLTNDECHKIKIELENLGAKIIIENK